MKKIMVFIPAILFSLFYGFIMISGAGSVSSTGFISLALLCISGFILYKNKPWGGFIGILIGISLVYQSTQYTMQAIDIEKPLGIILIVFYAVCSIVIFYRNKKEQSPLPDGQIQ